jgi:membrane protease YdiL (CAAX protease family)
VAGSRCRSRPSAAPHRAPAAEPPTAVILAAVLALPMTYLWLRRGLEAAIGFHFAVDLARYAAAYWAPQGIG